MQLETALLFQVFVTDLQIDSNFHYKKVFACIKKKKKNVLQMRWIYQIKSSNSMVQGIKTYRYSISINSNVIKTEHFLYSFSPFDFF